MKINLILIAGFLTIISCSSPEQQTEATQETDKVSQEATLETDQTSQESAAETNNNDPLTSKFNSDITNYLDAFNDKNWDGVLDMIYPKLFEVLPKSQMKATFSQMKAMGMDMQTDFGKVEKISQVVYHEDLKFCRVYYSGGISIKVSGEMAESKDMLFQNFSSTYGEKAVKFDEASNTFDIQATKSMIAVADKDLDNWTYLEYNEQQAALWEQLIPKEVLNQIK